MEEHTYIKPKHTAEQCEAIRVCKYQLFGKMLTASEYIEHSLMDGLACLDIAHTIAIIEAVNHAGVHADAYEPIINAIVLIADVYSRKHYALTSIVNWEPVADKPLRAIADVFACAYTLCPQDMFADIISENEAMIAKHHQDEKLFAVIRDNPKHSYHVWEQHAAANITGMPKHEREAAYNRTVSRCVDDWSYTAIRRECELMRNAHQRCTTLLNKFVGQVNAHNQPPPRNRPVSMPVVSSAQARPASSSAKRIRFPSSLAV